MLSKHSTHQYFIIYNKDSYHKGSQLERALSYYLIHCEVSD